MLYMYYARDEAILEDGAVEDEDRLTGDGAGDGMREGDEAVEYEAIPTEDGIRDGKDIAMTGRIF